VGPDWVLWLIFSVGSVGSLLAFRSPLLRFMKAREGASTPVDSLVGVQVVLSDDVPPHGQGKAELRGTVWNVENAGDTALSRGQRCRVARVEGLKLVVQAE
jgi:membrane protein implicated in regulation of membrane protease activity